jgi:hypothetical protein
MVTPHRELEVQLGGCADRQPHACRAIGGRSGHAQYAARGATGVPPYLDTG